MDEIKFCALHEISKSEINTLKEQTLKVEVSIDRALAEVYETMTNDNKKIADSLKEYKSNTDKSIDKLILDIQALFGNYHSLRETVLDIRNTVERSSDRTSTRLDKLTEDIKTFVESKKDSKNFFILPVLSAIISGSVVGIVIYVLSHFIK